VPCGVLRRRRGHPVRAGAGRGSDARCPLVHRRPLNYAHHALRDLAADQPAVIALDETGAGYEVAGERLRSLAASVAATLRDLGVGKGDRVVG